MNTKLFRQAEAISKRWEGRDHLVAEAWMRVAMFYQRGDMKLAAKEIRKADRLADTSDCSVVSAVTKEGGTMTYAIEAKRIIAAAEADGLTIDDGNVTDLLLDNLPRLGLSEVPRVLTDAGLVARFPRSCKGGK